MYQIIFLEAKTQALIIKLKLLKGNLLKYYHVYEKDGFTISFQNGQHHNNLPPQKLFLIICKRLNSLGMCVQNEPIKTEQ